MSYWLCMSVAAALLALNLATPSAFAAETAAYAAPDTTPADEPLWEWRLAGFARYGAAYPASEDSQFNIIPLPLPVYRGKILRLGEDTESPIKGRLFRRDRIKLDFTFNLNFPVDSDDVDARTDMPDLDLLLEIGPELEFEFARPAAFGGRWFLALQLRPAFSFDGLDPTYRGIVFDPEFSYRKKLDGGRDELRLRIRPNKPALAAA